MMTDTNSDARVALSRSLDDMKRYEFNQVGFRHAKNNFITALEKLIDAKIEEKGTAT
jgi:hypothetical protein